MNILHYTLGLPPYRTGGLTKYSIDLMKEQTKSNKVFMCFPGKNTLTKKFKVKKYKAFNGIETFEFINTLPVPLLGGVSEIEAFIKDIPEANTEIEKFLLAIKPDIIHIHTLMGLPKEFVIIAKKLNIKTIFTTHDYYGLCPKVNFINCDGNLEKCESCNKDAYSLKMINIMQSSLYRNIKETKALKVLRKNTKKKVTIEEKEIVETKESFEKYTNFRKYYIDILENISSVHFNSSVSKKVFEKYCKIESGDILSITHGSVQDNRMKKTFDSEKLKIVFLGPLESYKGFGLLLKALKEVDFNLWELQVYGNSYEVEFEEGMNVTFNGRYDYSEVPDIMKKNDILIAPSIWNETFGFIILEAISYGMPIITNQNVGACDIIKDNVTGLISDGTKENLRDIIEKVIKDREILVNINKNILDSDFILEIEDHSLDIFLFYEKILKESV